MSTKSELAEAELDVLSAADNLVREILRHDIILSHLEQALVNAVLNLNKLKKAYFVGPSEIPKPTSVTNFEALELDLIFDDEEERQTLRYSEIVTKRSPPNGIEAIKEDIKSVK